MGMAVPFFLENPSPIYTSIIGPVNSFFGPFLKSLPGI
jgi:hypothetical protein